MVENTAIDFPIDEEWIIDEEKQQELVESYLVIEELKQKIADYQKKLEQLTITVEQGEHTTKEVRLFDVFDSFAGKSTYTKAFVEKNKGEYPIYSANTTDGGLFGMVNFFDFDTECIQITTNGAKAGTIFYRDHHKFSINGDAKVLIKKHDTIDYKYALYILQQVFIDQKFSWENKPSQAKLAELTFHIPILPDGSFDLTTQHQIAQTYETIAQIKSQMLAKMQELQDVQVIV